MRTPIVAVDGTAGSGKSSVSKGVAKALGLRYLDTGAMYRAATLWMLQNGIDVSDSESVAANADRPRISIGTDPQAPTIALDGVDVSAEIRTPPVTAAVSSVSAVPAVRKQMVALQRKAASDAADAGLGLIAEGRDIGTVVLPHADVKLFLVADPEVRAARRAAEDAARGHGGAVHATAAELARRDHADSSRSASPLVQAEDAIVIDGTFDDLDTVIAKAVAAVRSRIGEGT